MSDPFEDLLRSWMKRLDSEIESLEQVWVEVRRMKLDSAYRDRADKLEQALDLMRDVRLELSLSWLQRKRAADNKELA